MSGKISCKHILCTLIKCKNRCLQFFCKALANRNLQAVVVKGYHTFSIDVDTKVFKAKTILKYLQKYNKDEKRNLVQAITIPIAVNNMSETAPRRSHYIICCASLLPRTSGLVENYFLSL